MKTALITGASRGLGAALARELAQQDWTLIITARGFEALDAVRAELSQHTKVIALAGDIANPKHRADVAQAAKELGTLDAIVNNAGVLGPSPQPNLLDYPLDMLEQVYRVNVVAQLGLLQALRDLLRDDVRILNISSDAGVVAYGGWGGYGSSKAALEQLSAVLAAENPTWRVYWVDPGDMRTKMHQDAFPGEDISDRPLPETSVPGLIELLTGDLPSGRYQARNLHPKKQKRLNIALTVSDFDRALALYRDGLGLPVVESWDNNGHGVLLDAGRALLELLDESHTAEVNRIEAGKQVNGKVRLAFEVDDVQAAATQFTEAGAVAVNHAVLTPWQHRNQRFEATDGLQVTLFQDESHAEPAK